MPHRRTPYSPWTCHTAEHTTHHGPAPRPNILLTVDLPHRGSPYLLRTCSTAEHPTHCGPASPHPNHFLPFSLWNTLFTLDLPHCGTSYSPRTFPTAKNAAHSGPAPPRNTLLSFDLPQMEHPTDSTEDDLQKTFHLMAGWHTKHRNITLFVIFSDYPLLNSPSYTFH